MNKTLQIKDKIDGRTIRQAIEQLEALEAMYGENVGITVETEQYFGVGVARVILHVKEEAPA